jgi:hypothetical protein
MPEICIVIKLFDTSYAHLKKQRPLKTLAELVRTSNLTEIVLEQFLSSQLP